MARIYVSSTYNDLKEYRDSVRLALRRLGHEDIAMEYYVAEESRPVAKCLRDVENCDLYLGVIAFRYGFIPDGHDRSITELEYRHARQTGKACIILLADENSWPIGRVEIGALDKINEFRSELGREQVIAKFSNTDDIQARVMEAVTEWERQSGSRGLPASADWEIYCQRVVDKLRWVRLTVIAGAKQDKFAQIPLTEVFIPQMCTAGQPAYEVPEEVLQFKRNLFVSRASDALDERETLQLVTEDAPEGDGGLLNEFPEAALDVVARERKQVILGGPGSGKSTLLHYTLLKLCSPSNTDIPVFQDEKAPIPFLIELRQYVLRKAADFIDYIVEHSREFYGTHISGDSVRSLLREDGRALVLFDGLDEVFDPAERLAVIRRFDTFACEYPKARIIVTSRIVGYEATDLGLAGFIHYTLLDFTVKQIREFIPKWYTYYTWEGDERDAQSLIQKIIDNPRLMELAGNPLLLTMMAVIYKHQDLPEQRWKLYERCTDVLLEDWDIKRKSIDFKTFPLDVPIRASQKAEILQRVSMYMLEHSQHGKELNAIAYQPLMIILAKYLVERYNKPGGEAEAIAKEILNHLRERTYILAEVGEGIFGFVHRTFMEYFAAAFCKAEFNAKKADYTWLTNQVFRRHWKRDEWHEVLLLLIAMLSDQGSPISEVINYLLTKTKVEPPFNLAFAARCLAEAGNAEGQKWGQRVISELVEAIALYAAQTKKEKAAQFLDAGLTSFSVLAPLTLIPEIAGAAIARLESSSNLRERMAAWQMGLALRSREERLEYALSALHAKEEAVRRGAIAALERDWPGKPEVGDALVNLLRTVRALRIRQAAIEALQRSWPGRVEILHAIKARIRDEGSNAYLLRVLRYTVSSWRGHALGLDLVKEIINWDRGTGDYSSAEVRSNAVRALADGWRDNPEAKSLLQGLAVNNRFADVRATALQVLCIVWVDDPKTLFIVQDRIINDRDHSVRMAAVRALASGWPRIPESLPIVLNRATEDPAGQVRMTAVKVLSARQRPGLLLRPWSHVWLNDDFEYIAPRQNAQGVDFDWSNDPRVFPLLLDRSFNDVDGEVRLTAIQALAIGWSNHRETSPLVLDRAANDPDPRVRAGSLAIHAGYSHHYHHYTTSRVRMIFQRPEFALHHPHLLFYSGLTALAPRSRETRSQAIGLLCDRAQNDSHAYVRIAAICLLGATLFEEREYNTELASILRMRAIVDADETARFAALLVLSSHIAVNREISEVFKDRSVNDPSKSIRTLTQMYISRN